MVQMYTQAQWLDRLREDERLRQVLPRSLGEAIRSKAERAW